MSEINFNTYIDPNAIEEKSIEKTHLSQDIQESLDNVASGITVVAINQEVDDANITNYITNPVFTQELNKKQNVISDLSTIRSNAEKATTAVQPNQVSSLAVTGIKMNGSLKGVNGVVDLGAVITSLPAATTAVTGVVRLTNSTSSNAEDVAATPKAVKTAYDLASSANTKANSAYTKATTPATTSVAGVVQLSSNINSTSETVAATSKAVKSAYDKATANTASINTLRSDFNTLVSGNTDATINNFREITNFLEQFNTGDTLAKTLANLEPTYKSELSGNIKMYNAVGGISSGTKVSNLTGKTVNDILDDLLFPLLTPKSTDHTDPSISGFELTPDDSPVLINSNVTKNVSNAIFNPGKWTKYDTSINYAGTIASSAYTFTINGTTFTKTTISSITGLTSFPSQYTTPGDHEYKVTINYNKGPYPVNSRGIQYTGLTAPASSITLTKNINVTYPWFATTATAGALTQQSTLIKWTTSDMNTGEFELKPHTTTASQKFSIPRSVKTISLFDTASGTWKADSLSNWTLTNENKTINGKANCPYYTYTFNGADKRGSVKIKVTF